MKFLIFADLMGNRWKFHCVTVHFDVANKVNTFNFHESTRNLMKLPCNYRTRRSSCENWWFCFLSRKSSKKLLAPLSLSLIRRALNFFSQFLSVIWTTEFILAWKQNISNEKSQIYLNYRTSVSENEWSWNFGEGKSARNKEITLINRKTREKS